MTNSTGSGVDGGGVAAQLALAESSTTAHEARVDSPKPSNQNRPQKSPGLWAEAWRDLRRRPLFIISSLMILIVVFLAAFPTLFTSVDPAAQSFERTLQTPDLSSWDAAWFGYDQQGRDVFARTIYGARASVLVGLFSTIFVMLIGGTMGLIAGYVGGWVDAILSRVADVFFGLPFLLGGIVILSTFITLDANQNQYRIMGLVVATISVLAWPIAMRIVRSSAISTRQQDFVRAARGLGAGPGRIVRQHVLPNSIAPALVYGTIAFGGFVGAEAALSFLGIGLRPPVVSWGVMISESQTYITSYPHLLFFPAAALVFTVLAFVMLGDAVRDAIDPKQK